MRRAMSGSLPPAASPVVSRASDSAVILIDDARAPGPRRHPPGRPARAARRRAPLPPARRLGRRRRHRRRQPRRDALARTATCRPGRDTERSGAGGSGGSGTGSGARIEDLPPQPPRPHPLPDHDVAFYDHVWRMDAGRRVVVRVARGARAGRPPEPGERAAVARWTGWRRARPGFDGHRWAVEERRSAGSPRASSSRRTSPCGSRASSHGDPLDAFADASETHAPPYARVLQDRRRRHPVLLTRAVPAPPRRPRPHAPIKGTATDRATLEASAKDAGRAHDDRRPRPQRPRPRRRLRHGDASASRASTSTPASSTWSPTSRPSDDGDDRGRSCAPPSRPARVTGAPKVAGHEDDRRARGDRPRGLHRRDRLPQPARRPRAQRRDPHARGRRRPRVARRRRRHRRRLRPGRTSSPRRSPRRGPSSRALGARTPDPTAWRRQPLPPLLEIARPDRRPPGDHARRRRPDPPASMPTCNGSATIPPERSWKRRRQPPATAAGASGSSTAAVEVEPGDRATTHRHPRPRLIPGGLGDRKWADRRVPPDTLIVDADGARPRGRLGQRLHRRGRRAHHPAGRRPATPRHHPRARSAQRRGADRPRAPRRRRRAST